MIMNEATIVHLEVKKPSMIIVVGFKSMARPPVVPVASNSTICY
jgi:hypothetical protein